MGSTLRRLSGRGGLKTHEHGDGLCGADFGKETVFRCCERVLANTYHAEAEAIAPLAVGESLKVHFGSKEQFAKRVGIKQPRSRRNIYHVLLARHRTLLGGKWAARLLELLHKASDCPQVEDPHAFIAYVKERVLRCLCGDKIITACRRQHIPIRRGGWIAGLITHGVP